MPAILQGVLLNVVSQASPLPSRSVSFWSELAVRGQLSAPSCDAVVVVVRIAGVALCVAVVVLLAGVRRRAAVVPRVDDAVAVAVGVVDDGVVGRGAGGVRVAGARRSPCRRRSRRSRAAAREPADGDLVGRAAPAHGDVRVPGAVPPTVTSAGVNPVTGSLKTTLKRIGSVPVGSACPAAWLIGDRGPHGVVVDRVVGGRACRVRVARGVGGLAGPDRGRDTAATREAADGDLVARAAAAHGDRRRAGGAAADRDVVLGEVADRFAEGDAEADRERVRRVGLPDLPG